ncbi:hypothetical protein KC331_g76 [Hortaea werneckii]|nr:hypothetical protein KC331_g76 [Hortaea werneckii]
MGKSRVVAREESVFILSPKVMVQGHIPFCECQVTTRLSVNVEAVMGNLGHGEAEMKQLIVRSVQSCHALKKSQLESLSLPNLCLPACYHIEQARLAGAMQSQTKHSGDHSISGGKVILYIFADFGGVKALATYPVLFLHQECESAGVGICLTVEFCRSSDAGLGTFPGFLRGQPRALRHADHASHRRERSVVLLCRLRSNAECAGLGNEDECMEVATHAIETPSLTQSRPDTRSMHSSAGHHCCKPGPNNFQIRLPQNIDGSFIQTLKESHPHISWEGEVGGGGMPSRLIGFLAIVIIATNRHGIILIRLQDYLLIPTASSHSSHASAMSTSGKLFTSPSLLFHGTSISSSGKYVKNPSYSFAFFYLERLLYYSRCLLKNRSNAFCGLIPDQLTRILGSTRLDDLPTYDIERTCLRTPYGSAVRATGPTASG